jgi:hypothetical protein
MTAASTPARPATVRASAISGVQPAASSVPAIAAAISAVAS